MDSGFEGASVLEETEVEDLSLFQVWVDDNCGFPPGPAWEINSDPQPLRTALVEAQECRTLGFPSVIMLEGVSPRLDGSFD